MVLIRNMLSKHCIYACMYRKHMCVCVQTMLIYHCGSGIALILSAGPVLTPPLKCSPNSVTV